jgi:peroxiredoxin Q/BCP
MRHGAEVIGVSTDKQATSDSFATELDLPYRLIGDAGGRITAAFGAKWPLLPVARRTTYVVGRDRRVLMAYRSERDVMAHVRHAAAVIGLEIPED